MSNSSHLIPLHLIGRISSEDATLLCTQTLVIITAMLHVKAKPVDANSSTKLTEEQQDIVRMGMLCLDNQRQPSVKTSHVGRACLHHS